MKGSKDREARDRPVLAREAATPRLSPFAEVLAKVVSGSCSIIASEAVQCPLCGLMTTPHVLHECRRGP